MEIAYGVNQHRLFDELTKSCQGAEICGLPSRSTSEFGETVEFQFEFFARDHWVGANYNILAEITGIQKRLPI